MGQSPTSVSPGATPMDLVQLRSFVEVAEKGTVAAAARTLGYTSPAVSQHLAKLEKSLETLLFDRVGRRVVLAPAGEALLPVALEMLDLNDQVHAAVTNPARPTTLTVAGFASAITTVVIPALPALPDDLSLRILEAEDHEAMRELRLGHVEIVLTQEYGAAAPTGDRRLVYTPIVRDELRIVIGAGRSPDTTLQDLAHDTWLLNGPETRCTAATERILTAAGLRPPIGANVSDNQTLLSLVAAGHGVSIMPQSAISQSAAAVDVATQRLGETRTIYAVHRTVLSTAVEPVVQALTNASA